MPPIYKNYMFRDKDPIIDQLRTAIEEEEMTYAEVSAASGVTVQTLYNWFTGPTKRPQFATVMAVARGIGRNIMLVRSNSIRSAKVIRLRK